MQGLLKRHGLIDVTTKVPTFRTTATRINNTITTTATTTKTATAGTRQAVDLEDAQAQVEQGDCYWNGTGVSVYKAQAFEWYSAAAYQGLAEAQFSLGRCYWYGMGVDKDQIQATQWFRKAATQGYVQANTFLT